MKIMNISALKKQSAASLKELKEYAEHYCRHEFNILGSGWKKVFYGMNVDGFEGKNYAPEFSYEKLLKEIPENLINEHKKLMGFAKKIRKNYIPIDWQIDFKSGFRFNAGVHHTQLKYGVIEGVDAKVSADLGRGYQFVVLAKAYRATGEKKYRNECIAQLLDWIASNPYEHGAGWRACMNVSIRAANLVAAVDILGLDDEKELLDLIRNSFIQHGKFIMENLEYPQNNFHPNHFIANLAGLLMIAAYIKDWHKEAVTWYDFALKTLSGEILNQSLPDGANYEGATSYHGLVMEMLIISIVFAAVADAAKKPAAVRGWLEKNIGKKEAARLKDMFGVLRHITQPDGKIPLIGDNDSGRFVLLEGGACVPARDWRFLLVLGSVLYEDGSLYPENFCDSQTARLLLDVKSNSKHGAQYPLSKAYKDVGYYIMRNKKDYMLINCGPVGTDGKGGHAHNDKLAFTLMLDGLDIFVDPGIYTYTASQYFRNSYRSVKAHNALCLGGEEQNRWGLANPWWGVLEESKCECLKWKTSDAKDIFAGSHHAYERLENGATHQRTIEWKKSANEITVLDELLNAKGKLPASELGFMLHNDCVITLYSEKEIHLCRENVEVKMISDNGCWKTEPAFLSLEYGTKVYSQRLVLKLEGSVMRNHINIQF
ncbi:MAG: hypothetical protein A2017_00435 [Lentisphaerae bacterium GWF2_44_16]|nr:MAG: hypothetical protein A2017_00435 [Lentisphaerae bacterium GWF2_44_16]